jgi:hypothetical protein
MASSTASKQREMSIKAEELGEEILMHKQTVENALIIAS